MPRVSVIMPTYNVEEYIDEAVNSILIQTYGDFELIIVDDCSTDHTYEKLLDYADKDKRVVVRRNKENRKICYTLNRCLSLCHGEFVLRMDGDDISTPDRIEVMLRYLESHPDISLVGSQSVTIDKDGNETGRKRYLHKNRFIEFGNRFYPCVVHIWMARKDMYDKLKGYRNLPYVEDYDFLLRGSKAGFKYANCNEYLYMIRIREGNTASSNGLRQKKAVEYIKNRHFKKKGLFNSQTPVTIDFNSYIESDKLESMKYGKASDLLSKAILEHNKLKKICFACLAGTKSKYIRSYLMDAICVRLLVALEKVTKNDR